MIRETVVIRGREYIASAVKGGLSHKQGVARLVSLVSVETGRIVWGKV